MEISTKEVAMEVVLKAIPYPEHLSDFDFTSEKTAIIFTWRHNRFRLDIEYISVEEVGNGVLSGSNMSILLQELIKREFIRRNT